MDVIEIEDPIIRWYLEENNKINKQQDEVIDGLKKIQENLNNISNNIKNDLNNIKYQYNNNGQVRRNKNNKRKET